jgi:hypothetical protein
MNVYVEHQHWGIQHAPKGREAMGLSRIVLAVLVVLWTILGPAVSAQQPVRRLGYLGSGPAPPPGTPQHAFEAFR